MPLLLAWRGDTGSDTALSAVGRPRLSSVVLNLRGLYNGVHPVSPGGSQELLTGCSSSPCPCPVGEQLPGGPDTTDPAGELLIGSSCAGPAGAVMEQPPGCPGAGPSGPRQELGLEMETMGRRPSTG